MLKKWRLWGKEEGSVPTKKALGKKRENYEGRIEKRGGGKEEPFCGGKGWVSGAKEGVFSSVWGEKKKDIATIMSPRRNRKEGTGLSILCLAQ